MKIVEMSKRKQIWFVWIFLSHFFVFALQLFEFCLNQHTLLKIFRIWRFRIVCNSELLIDRLFWKLETIWMQKNCETFRQTHVQIDCVSRVIFQIFAKLSISFNCCRIDLMLRNRFDVKEFWIIQTNSCSIWMYIIRNSLSFCMIVEFVQLL